MRQHISPLLMHSCSALFARSHLPCSLGSLLSLAMPALKNAVWGLNMHSQRSKLWRARPCNDKPLSGLYFSTFNTLGLAPAHGFPVRPDTPKHQQLVAAITCILKKSKIPDGANMKPPVYQTPRLVLSDAREGQRCGRLRAHRNTYKRIRIRKNDGGVIFSWGGQK